MRPVPEVHDALACLLTYPGYAHSGMRYPAAVEVVARGCPDAADDVRRFLNEIDELDEGELEELYTRTFDNVGERSLEIGWQLFGENYARGVLMVRFRALMRKYDVAEHIELPDHLTHVIALLGRMPADLAAAFSSAQVYQAVEKIAEALGTFGSPWSHVLSASQTVLRMHGAATTQTAGVTR